MVTDLDAVLQAHERVTAAFAAAIRTAPGETRVPHLAWTVGQLGAHVLAGIRAYEQAAREGGNVWSSLSEGDAENARLLERTPEREPGVIADLLEPAARSLHQAWRSADSVVHWSGGLTLPVDVVAGVQLADVLVHGWDLTRVTRTPWKISSGDAILAIRAVAVIAPHFVAPAAQDVSAVYEIRLRGDGRLVFAFDDGALSVDVGDQRRVDCRVHADPATFLLTSYGRLPVWRAAMSGGLIASGRKPWLALRFKSLLVSP